MQKMFDFISSFIDDNGDVKELDLTKTEDYNKVKELLKLTKDNFGEDTGKYSFLTPFFNWLPSDNTIDELEKLVDEIHEKGNQKENKEADYEIQMEEDTKKKENCVLISDEQEKHLHNIVDRYMKEEILPRLNLSANDEKNMNLAFFDFAKWIYTV